MHLESYEWNRFNEIMNHSTSCEEGWESESDSGMSNSFRPMDSSLTDSSIHELLQARILEWVAVPSPGDLTNPGIQLISPALQVYSLPSELLGNVGSLV